MGENHDHWLHTGIQGSMLEHHGTRVFNVPPTIVIQLHAGILHIHAHEMNLRMRSFAATPKKNGKRNENANDRKAEHSP